jgi:hypothetical protein
MGKQLVVRVSLVVALCSLYVPLSQAADVETRSRIIATGGATTLEGAAGGGIVPMAVISGYGAQEEWGATAFASYVNTPDYALKVAGASWSYHNRIELSVAEQQLVHQSLTDALHLPDNAINQRILGAKLRLAGDLIYTDIPQVSAGLEYKHNEDFFVPKAVGAKKDSGTDYYVSATKLILAGIGERNWLLNATARYTNANQTGLVGFGGDANADRQWMAEASTAVFFNTHWALGAEYRQKPDNLAAIKEDDWQTLFLAWFPSKHFSLVAAYVDLGEVATFKDQTGWYLSAQGSF